MTKNGLIGDRVRRLRVARGWSLRHLARMTGLNQSYLSKLEAGKVQSPGANAIARLAEAFGVAAGALLGGEEAQPRLSAPGTAEYVARELVREWRDLPEAERQLILEMIEARRRYRERVASEQRR